MKLITVAFAVIVLPNLSLGQSTLLRFKFSPGSTHRQKTSMTMKMSYSGAGMPPGSAMTMTSNAVQTLKVLNVAKDGTATIKTTTESVGGTVNGQASPSKSIPKPITMRMSPSGKVSGLQMGTQSAGGVSLSGLQNMQASTILPDKPVSVGSHWSSTINMGSGKPITFTSKLLKLSKSGKDQLAEILSTGSMDPSSFGQMLGSTAGGMKMNGTINFKFTFVLNLSKGWITGQTGGATFNMQMSAPNARTGQSTQIHITGNQTMQIQSLS